MGSNILIAILILGLLIFVHELGHFAVAKWSGVTVLRFSLGFGPRLFSWRRGATEYAVSAIPLGGYVKMLGDDPEDEVPSADAAHAFSQQTLPKRAAIVLAGPLMNLVTACVAFTTVFALFGAGTPSDAAKIGGVMEGMAAAKAGLRRGDTVMSIDGTAVATWDELSKAVRASGGAVLAVEVQRDDGHESHGCDTLEQPCPHARLGVPPCFDGADPAPQNLPVAHGSSRPRRRRRAGCRPQGKAWRVARARSRPSGPPSRRRR